MYDDSVGERSPENTGYVRGVYSDEGTSEKSRNSYGSYSGYGSNSYSNYDFDRKTPDAASNTKKVSGNKKSGSGFWGKILTAILTGLIFGGCAAGAAYGVAEYTGVLDAAKTVRVFHSKYAPQLEVLESYKDNIALLSDKGLNADGQSSGEAIAAEDMAEASASTVMDVSEVVKRVMPAMVSIQNSYIYRNSNFWGQSWDEEAVSSGTGIIVGINDEELLVATNFHVIEDAEQIVVQFVDGTESEATAKGTSPDMDLAVISVPVTKVGESTMSSIDAATLGDSESLVVGQPAIAIGNALGYGQSVSTGVVSALNRTVELENGKSGVFIQTDAAINPGNSGGALLDINGLVIGINSSKIGGTAIEGMGYAIPISAAKPIISELMLQQTRTRVSDDQRGYLGISGITVTRDISESYGMPVGVYIAKVYQGTAAGDAGIAEGDVIIAFNGSTITSMSELEAEIEYCAKGDEVEIIYMTPATGGYEERTIRLKLGSR